MEFSKLYNPTRFNSWQFIAFTGLLMSAGAGLLIRFAFARPLPPGFNWLYVCWAALFVVGLLINLFGKPAEGHHHHH